MSIRFGYWLPMFGGWLRNVEDEKMAATWEYVRDLAIRSEQIGFDITLIAELNLNDIKGPDAPSLDAWTTEPDLGRFRSLLVEENRIWAAAAPLLILVLARRHFTKTGEPNRWAEFDCGAAWMSLALQARKLGLYTHAMAGFDENRAYQVLEISRETFCALAMIAVGRLGDRRALPEKLASRDHPNDRRPLEQSAVEG